MDVSVTEACLPLLMCSRTLFLFRSSCRAADFALKDPQPFVCRRSLHSNHTGSLQLPQTPACRDYLPKTEDYPMQPSEHRRTSTSEIRAGEDGNDRRDNHPDA
jgi:hypothetical protein